MPESMPQRVLVVEDDAGVRGLMQALLGDTYSVDFAPDGEVAIQKMRDRRYAAILLDLMIPRLNGFELIRFIRSASPDTLPRVIIVTAASTSTLDFFEDEKHVHALLRKPFDISHLLTTVRSCVAGIPADPTLSH